MKDSGNNTQKNKTTALVRVTGNKQFKLVCYLTYLVDNDLLPKEVPSYHIDHMMFHEIREHREPDFPMDEEDFRNATGKQKVIRSLMHDMEEFRDRCPNLSSGMDEPLTPD